MGLFSSEPVNRPYRNKRSGKQVCCSHCGGWDFQLHEAQLNTSLLSAADLDFLNHSAWALECAGCGHIEWFYDADSLEPIN